MGEQVLADLGPDAALSIGFITEPDERPVVIRDEGFTDAVSANPNAEVVAKVDGNVKPDDSLRVTGEMLQGNQDVNVIWASTGPAVYGALQALGNRTDVALYGFCASEEPLTEVPRLRRAGAGELRHAGDRADPRVRRRRGRRAGDPPAAQGVHRRRDPCAGEVG